MWALYMFFNKYLLNIWHMIVLRKKVAIEFVVDDITMYKNVSLLATLIILIVSEFDCY
jgi:hypothetical protein